MGAITVTRQFAEDFEYFCRRTEMPADEAYALRMKIRSDFAANEPWLTETVAVMRWCDELWGEVPPAELLIGYMASKGVFVSEHVARTFGPMALAKGAWEVRNEPDLSSKKDPAEAGK